MHRIPHFAAFLAVVLIIGGSFSVLQDPNPIAQETTPTPTFPATPNPAQCQVEPRLADAIVALLGTPPAPTVPDSATPASEPSRIEVPLGRPANADVEAGVIATVYELQSCFNAGDFRRAFALVTDAYLQDFADEASLTAQDIAFFTAEPTPVLMDARTSILAVTDVSLLGSGRAGAFVITDTPFTGPDTTYMNFVQQGDRWLVDEVIGFR